MPTLQKRHRKNQMRPLRHRYSDKMIKVIFFDIGGVYLRNSLSTIIDLIADKIASGRKSVEKAIMEFIFDFMTGNMGKDEFFEKVSAKIKASPKALERLWVSEDIFNVNKSVKELVERLKRSSYAVACITDVDPLILAENRRRGLYSVFDFCVNSIDEKSTKYDGKIYLSAIKKAGTTPDECLVIDDTKEKLAAAKELGMRTILFENVVQLKKDLKKNKIKF